MGIRKPPALGNLALHEARRMPDPRRRETTKIVRSSGVASLMPDGMITENVFDYKIVMHQGGAKWR
jgi:hypothetical protein